MTMKNTVRGLIATVIAIVVFNIDATAQLVDSRTANSMAYGITKVMDTVKDCLHWGYHYFFGY